VADSGSVAALPASLTAPLRGLRTGLEPETTPAHVARAVLEGLAHENAGVVSLMRHGVPAEVAEITGLRADGDLADSDLLLQVQADLGRVPVYSPIFGDTVLLGAAVIAGIGARALPGMEQLDRQAPLSWENAWSTLMVAHQDRTFWPSLPPDGVPPRAELWEHAKRLMEKSR
jgi:glycerol kinase